VHLHQLVGTVRLHHNPNPQHVLPYPLVHPARSCSGR
jgi:hypothetical protein